ncbi:hypothetical protein BJ912DRAFT_991403, partial [Pholiota molesta]
MLWPCAYGTSSNVAAPLASISPGAYHWPAQWLDASSAFDMRPDGMAYDPVFAHPNIGELPVAPPSVRRQQNGATDMAASGSQRETTEAYANDAQMLITRRYRRQSPASPVFNARKCASTVVIIACLVIRILSVVLILYALTIRIFVVRPHFRVHRMSCRPLVVVVTRATMSTGASPLSLSIQSPMAPSSLIWPGPSSTSASSPLQHPTHPTASSSSSGSTEEDVDDPNATLLGWLAQNTGAAAVAALISQYYGTPYK